MWLTMGRRGTTRYEHMPISAWLSYIHKQAAVPTWGKVLAAIQAPPLCKYSSTVSLLELQARGHLHRVQATSIIQTSIITQTHAYYKQ